MNTDQETGSAPQDKRIRGDSERYLEFSLCSEEYAVPLLKVKEVIGMPDITGVPHTPPHFRGIMNLRGQIISIIDLRLKFRMAKAEFTPETAVVILDLGHQFLGVIVDSVNCVLTVEPGKVSAKPDIESSVNSDYITGVTRKDEKLVILIDIEKTLSREDVASLKQKHMPQSNAA